MTTVCEAVDRDPDHPHNDQQQQQQQQQQQDHRRSLNTRLLSEAISSLILLPVSRSRACSPLKLMNDEWTNATQRTAKALRPGPFILAEFFCFFWCATLFLLSAAMAAINRVERVDSDSFPVRVTLSALIRERDGHGGFSVAAGMGTQVTPLPHGSRSNQRRVQCLMRLSAFGSTSVAVAVARYSGLEIFSRIYFVGLCW